MKASHGSKPLSVYFPTDWLLFSQLINGLETIGIDTQLIVSNLIIPKEHAITPFFKNRRNMQLKYIDEIKDRFDESYVLEVPMYEKEIKGISMLKNIADAVFNK